MVKVYSHQSVHVVNLIGAMASIRVISIGTDVSSTRSTNDTIANCFRSAVNGYCDRFYGGCQFFGPVNRLTAFNFNGVAHIVEVILTATYHVAAGLDSDEASQLLIDMTREVTGLAAADNTEVDPEVTRIVRTCIAAQAAQAMAFKFVEYFTSTPSTS